MDREQFLKKMEEIIQTDDPLSFETKLNDIQEWDSITAMSVIAYLNNNFNAGITYTDIPKFVTIDDFAKRAGL